MRIFTKTPAELSYKALWLNWGIIAAMAIAVMVWTPLAGFDFPILNFLYLTIATAGMQVCAMLVKAARVRDGEYAFMLLQSIAMILVGSIVAQMIMYLSNSLAFPLTDIPLIAIDHFLGFDWKNYYAWLTHYPKIMATLEAAYASLLPELALVLWLSAFTRRIRNMERLVCAYFITLAITIVISSLWPAVGAYLFYRIDPAEFGSYLPAALAHAHDLLALRNHELTHFPIIMKGLVTFPSFHATGAVLLMWAFWPLRYWRPFNLVLNSLMIVASIASGGHYLIDIIGGIIIALIGISITNKLLPEKPLL